MSWNPEKKVLEASGKGVGRTDGPLELWFPGDGWRMSGTNLGKARWKGVGPGVLLTVNVIGSDWSLRMQQR